MSDRINVSWNSQGLYEFSDVPPGNTGTGKDGAIKVAGWFRSCFGGTMTLHGVDKAGAPVQVTVIKNSLVKYANSQIETAAAGLHLDPLEEGWGIFGGGSSKKDVDLGVLFALGRGHVLLNRGLGALTIPAGKEDDPATIKQLNRGLTALAYASKLGITSNNQSDAAPILHACAKLYAHYGAGTPIANKADDLMQTYQQLMKDAADEQATAGDPKPFIKYLFALLEMAKLSKKSDYLEIVMAWVGNKASLDAAKDPLGGKFQQILLEMRKIHTDTDMANFKIPDGCDLQSMLALVP